MREVTIVGAGPVGLLLAVLLAQRGVDVEVLERRREPPAHSRAIGIHPPGLRALDAAGVGEAARAAGTSILDGVVSCDGRRLGRLSFERGGDHARIVALPQLVTEHLLDRRLAETAPGRLRRGAAVGAVEDRGSHVEFAVSEGGVERVDRARYLVAADGVHSGIREQLAVPWQRRPGRAEYVMGDVADDTDAPTTALLHFERGGVVESFPLPGARRRWVALVTDSSGRGTAAGLAEAIAVRTGVLLDPEGFSMVSAFEARQHLAARMTVGRVVLAGDAAHEISPIGGQGMNLGWLDALRLQSAIPEALGGGRDALDAYDRDRRRSARRASRQAAFNMRMGMPAEGARLLVRNAIVRGLAVPPLRGALANAFTMRGL